MYVFRIFSCAFLFIFLCFGTVTADEAPSMPPVLAAELGLVDGCTVLESTQVWDVETCTLDCGKMHPNKAAGGYKKLLDGNGFANTTLDWHDGGTRAMGEKNGASAVIQANKVDGNTTVLMTIDNIEALGGTPVDPNAQAETTESTEQAGDAMDAGAGGDETGGSAGGGAVPADSGTTEPAAPVDMSNVPMTVEGAGAADEIWEIVPMRPDDTLLEEFQTNGNPGTVIASDASTKEILDYYSDALESQGWMQAAYFVESDGGLVTLMKAEKTMTIFCDAEIESGGVEYSVMLSKEN